MICGKPIILLALLGDIMLGRGVNQEIPLHPPAHFWGTTLPILQSADAVFGNLECAITSHTHPWSKTYKVFHFRADPAAINLLKIANIQGVSLANNHSLDFEEQGLLDTLRHLDQADIVHVGVGTNLAQARAPAIITIKGLKVGFIAATDNEPVFAARENKPGTNYLSIELKPDTLTHLQQDIEGAKKAGAEFIILSLHWGPNMVQVPPARFRSFAQAAIDMGVDVIHGHSAHLFQGVEFYRHGVIFYDTGDFLDDYAVDSVLRNDWSFIFMLEIKGKRVHKVKLRPVRLKYAQTNLASGEEAEAIMTRMKKLCTPFGTVVQEVPKGLELSQAKAEEP